MPTNQGVYLVRMTHEWAGPLHFDPITWSRGFIVLTATPSTRQRANLRPPIACT